MGNLRFDWRWLIAIVVLVALTNSARLPWPVTVLIVGAGGVWLLLIGWRVWVREGGPPARARVTYWRGQRIERWPRRAVARPSAYARYQPGRAVPHSRRRAAAGGAGDCAAQPGDLVQVGRL
ncbi:MAG: hypothetical protein U0Z44_18695 [Kouleothrix sp.]